MISHLNGTVCSLAPDGAVIDVGGVGLAVQCTTATLARPSLDDVYLRYAGRRFAEADQSHATHDPEGASR